MELNQKVQFSSVAQSCPTLKSHELYHARLPCPSTTPGIYSHCVHWAGDAIFCRPLLLPSSIFPSIRVFSNESVLHIRWPKYWSFSFSISPSNEYLGIISLKMDWLDLLAVQGTLKSLLQHHSSKASILWHSAFFIVQLSHPYLTTGKYIWTFVGNVSAFWYAVQVCHSFSSKEQTSFNLWLQSPSAVILEPKKIKSESWSWLFKGVLWGIWKSSTSRLYIVTLLI